MSQGTTAIEMSAPAPRARRMRPAWGSLAGGLLLGALLTAALTLFVGMPLALTRSTPLPLEEHYADYAVSMAVARVAGDATNPLAGNTQAIAAGKTAYEQACANCHGMDGSGKGGRGGGEYFYPPATNLTMPGSQEKSDAELHWIIKEGLAFTGMPSYSTRMDDNRIWSIVAYMRTLEPKP